MPTEEEEKAKAIAVANLNQLKFSISPISGTAVTTVPSDVIPIHISESLAQLGFNIHDGNNGDVCIIDKVGKPIASHTETGMTLHFSKSGVQKLIDKGVSTPTLDAVRGRVPEALKHRQ